MCKRCMNKSRNAIDSLIPKKPRKDKPHESLINHDYGFYDVSYD